MTLVQDMADLVGKVALKSDAHGIYRAARAKLRRRIWPFASSGAMKS